MATLSQVEEAKALETVTVPVELETVMSVPACKDCTPKLVIVIALVEVVIPMAVPALRAIVEVETPPKEFTMPLLLKVSQSAAERKPACEEVEVAWVKVTVWLEVL